MIVGQWSGVRCHTDCCRMLPAACCLLHAAQCMPPVACRLLHAACCMLPVACWQVEYAWDLPRVLETLKASTDELPLAQPYGLG